MSISIIVEERPNPSTDFFVLPKLLADNKNVVKFTFNQLPSAQQICGATIIFIRYVPKNWQQFVSSNRQNIRNVIFFMDDDLFDLRATQGTPLRYRYKLAKLSTVRQSWLVKTQASLWVSTPYLMKRYSKWNPVLIVPRAISDSKQTTRVFYHGSASHQDEIQWLYTVMSEVLAANQNISFELIGDYVVNKQYKQLPRTTVLHPMDWPSYKNLLQQPGRHIGLAPLLNKPFNQARSHTKFFDITLCNAVGIYADHPAYQSIVKHQENGFLLPMNSKTWADAILQLSQNESLRNEMLKTAKASQV